MSTTPGFNMYIGLRYIYMYLYIYIYTYIKTGLIDNLITVPSKNCSIPYIILCVLFCSLTPPPPHPTPSPRFVWWQIDKLITVASQKKCSIPYIILCVCVCVCVCFILLLVFFPPVLFGDICCPLRKCVDLHVYRVICGKNCYTC